MGWRKTRLELTTLPLGLKHKTRWDFLKDIIAAVSDNNTNINFANVKSKNNKVGIIELGIELDNIKHFEKKLSTVYNHWPEVYSVKRVQTSYAQTTPYNKKNYKTSKEKTEENVGWNEHGNMPRFIICIQKKNYNLNPIVNFYYNF